MTSRILLADDSITIQKVVNLTFADEGIEVVAVSNGELAERRLGEISPDLVLADIFMPGKNGYELCEFVKQSSQFRNVPVVLLVGAFEPFNEAEARRVRADAHLTKPFESRTLVETVRKLISKSGKPNTGSLGSGPLREQQKASVETAQVVPPPFNLDLAAMTQEWPATPPVAASEPSPFAVVPDIAVTEGSPLELDYGSFSHNNLAPTGFQMEVEPPAHDTGFSFSSVKDTAELPQLEGPPPGPAADSTWSSDDSGFQIQSGFSDIPSPVQHRADVVDSPLEGSDPGQGFKVKSTFETPDRDLVLDFEKIEAPSPQVPDEIVSFDVDFSTLSTTESTPSSQSAMEAEAPTSERMVTEGGWTGPDQHEAGGQTLPAPEVDGAFEIPEQSFAVDDPLGDILSAESAAVPMSEAVKSERMDFDLAPPEASSFEPAADRTEPTELAPTVLSDTFAPAERPSGVVHSGLSFEAFSPVIEESAREESAYEEREPVAWADRSAVFSEVNGSGMDQVTEMVDAPTSESEEPTFTSSEMWADEETTFAAIDIDSVAEEEQFASSDFAAPLDAETGFAFASVSESSVEEALTPDTPSEMADATVTSPAASPDSLVLSPTVMDEIVRRVVAEIGDRVVREIAWEVVPDCVERVVEKLTQEAVSKRM